MGYARYFYMDLGIWGGCGACARGRRGAGTAPRAHLRIKNTAGEARALVALLWQESNTQWTLLLLRARLPAEVETYRHPAAGASARTTRT